MRPLTIDLDELACALNTEGLDHYLDLFSGKLLLIPEEDADPELEALLREEPERFLLVEPLQACLLYTSPSPRDKRQSRMPSSA